MSAKFAVGQEVIIMQLRCTVKEVHHNPHVGFLYRVYHPMNPFYNVIEWRESSLMSVDEWEQEQTNLREALNASIRRKLAGHRWDKS